MLYCEQKGEVITAAVFVGLVIITAGIFFTSRWIQKKATAPLDIAAYTEDSSIDISKFKCTVDPTNDLILKCIATADSMRKGVAIRYVTFNYTYYNDAGEEKTDSKCNYKGESSFCYLDPPINPFTTEETTIEYPLSSWGKSVQIEFFVLTADDHTKKCSTTAFTLGDKKISIISGGLTCGSYELDKILPTGYVLDQPTPMLTPGPLTYWLSFGPWGEPQAFWDTAGKLFDYLLDKGQKIIKIRRWSGTSWQDYEPEKANDFEIKAGEGYLLNFASEPETLKNLGLHYKAVESLELTFSDNLSFISIPEAIIGKYKFDAKALCQSIKAQGGEVREIREQFDAMQDVWSVYLCSDKGINNFSLFGGKGYFVEAELGKDKQFTFQIPALSDSCEDLYYKIILSWEASCGQSLYNNSADINKDRIVDLVDLTLFFNDLSEDWCFKQLNDATDPCLGEIPSVAPSTTPTSTYTPTLIPLPTATNTLTPTPSLTVTATPTQTMTPTQTPTNTPSPTVTVTSTPTLTVTPSATFTPTYTVTPTSTSTPTLTSTPTITPSTTPTSTYTPTQTPSPTSTATLTPTASVTITPTQIPTDTPSITPTTTPTQTPIPTFTPTLTPSNTLTPTPTIACPECPFSIGTTVVDNGTGCTVNLTWENLETDYYNVLKALSPILPAPPPYDSVMDDDMGLLIDWVDPNNIAYDSSYNYEVQPIKEGCTTPSCPSTQTTATCPTITPTPTATQTVTPTQTPTLTPSPTVTVTSTPILTVTPSATFTPTYIITPTSTVTPTLTSTLTPTASVTITPTQKPTNTPTATPSLTVSPTNTPSITATTTLTPTPTVSSTPTLTPMFTNTPTWTPTITPALTTAYVSGDAEISAPAKGSTVRIRTASRFAGAIYSLKWNEKEFINSSDHGRELQYAWSLNDYGECYNPTEAGSSNDGSKNTSTSNLVNLNAEGNSLFTRSYPAFWLAPGQSSRWCYGGATSAVNTTLVSNHILSKRVTIGFASIDNVIEFLADIDIPESYRIATIEAPTGYLRSEFNSFWTYDPSIGTLTPLLTDGSNWGEQNLPVILSTKDRRYAMGVYSPDNVSGYGRWDWRPWGVMKWNVVFRLSGGPGIVQTRSYVIFGTLDDVTNSMGQLYNIFHPISTSSNITKQTPTPTALPAIAVLYPSCNALNQQEFSWDKQSGAIDYWVQAWNSNPTPTWYLNQWLGGPTEAVAFDRPGETINAHVAWTNDQAYTNIADFSPTYYVYCPVPPGYSVE